MGYQGLWVLRGNFGINNDLGDLETMGYWGLGVMRGSIVVRSFRCLQLLSVSLILR